MAQKEDNTTLERLKSQRYKALNLLEKSRKSSNSYRNYTLDQGASWSGMKSQTISKLNETDYVPYRPKEKINISDLLTEHTIDLKPMNATTENKVSFEPSEMTGRSTMCPSIQACNPIRCRQSVKEILAQSFAGDIRSLSETISESCDSDASLKRSKTLSGDGQMARVTLSPVKKAKFEPTSSFEENFKPAELMNSRLAADERSWQQQYADIPNRDSSKIFSPTQLSDEPTSFSIGSFFAKRTGNMKEILDHMRSPTKKSPLPLVNQSNCANDTLPLKLCKVGTPLTSKIDNKTYEKHSRGSNWSCAIENSDKFNTHTLSMSAIQSALDELGSEDTMEDVLSRFLDSKRTAQNKLLQLKRNVDNAKSDHSLFSDFKEPLALNINQAEKENYNCSSNRDADLEATENMNETFLDILTRTSEGSQFLRRRLLKDSENAHLKSRKRTHSSSQLNNDSLSANKCFDRRSRSPTTCAELAAAAGMKNISITNLKEPTTTKRLASNPNGREHKLSAKGISSDCGKFSLPNHGEMLRSPSSLLNAVKQRCTSQCSSTSEYSHRGQTLPLKATSLEVVWGSVKLRKTILKSIQIKNTSEKKLRLKAEVSGPGFQLATPGDVHSLILQARECRTICLSFCPTIVGAAAGQLMFMPPHGATENHTHIKINLYGYGGHASLSFVGVIKGPLGSPFLPLGELKDLESSLRNSFLISNKGPVDGFACIFVDAVEMDMPRLSNSVEVHPKVALIQSEGSVNIKVAFRPRHEDRKKIFRKILDRPNNAVTIAVLKIVYGEDLTRRRIRKLINRMSTNEKSNFTGSLMYQACTQSFGEEQLDQMDVLREKTDSANELLGTLQSYEVALTLNYSSSENSVDASLLFSETDETIMFKTIISSDVTLCDSLVKSEQLALQFKNDQYTKLWSVQPKIVYVNPLNRSEKFSLLIRNEFPRKKPFRIESNSDDAIKFFPSDGTLLPRENVKIEGEMKYPFLGSDSIEIMVYLGNELTNIPVELKSIESEEFGSINTYT